MIAASAMNLVVELGWHACDWAGRAVPESDVDVTVDEQYEALIDLGMGHDEAFDTVRAYC